MMPIPGHASEEGGINVLHGTTIVGVRGADQVALAGDGQVTLGDGMIMKHTARKIRRLYHDQVLAGFAGSVADAMTLFEKFEGKIETHRGDLLRSAVELAKEWRTDRVLRRLEALLVVANLDELLIVSGAGEVIQPDDDIATVGSGSGYALAAGRMLKRHTSMQPEQIAQEALLAASEICVYTNDRITLEVLNRRSGE